MKLICMLPPDIFSVLASISPVFSFQQEEEVESSENIIEVISTEEVEEAVETVEAIETVETIEETEEPHSDGKAAKSSDTIVTTQPLNVIKNAFNFPGQIMKVTVSGGQIVSTKMIGQFSPKTVSANSTATTTKTTPATSNIMHVKPVKKVAVQPKPVSFQTVQNLRTFSKPVGIKRAASSSIDQSRNVSSSCFLSTSPLMLSSELFCTQTGLVLQQISYTATSLS